MIIQLETKRAFENLEAILSVPGVDVVWLGHYDLTVSMGPRKSTTKAPLQAMDDPLIDCLSQKARRRTRIPSPHAGIGSALDSQGVSHDQPGQRHRKFQREYRHSAMGCSFHPSKCHRGRRGEMKYTVQAFNAGTFWVPGPEVYWMESWGTREEMKVIIYLIRGGDHNILINTGPPQDLQ